MSKKSAMDALSEQSQSATQQAAATIEHAKETVQQRLARLRERLGLEPRRVTQSDLKAVTR